MVRLDDTRRVRAECNDVPDDGLPCPFTGRADSASYPLAVHCICILYLCICICMYDIYVPPDLFTGRADSASYTLAGYIVHSVWCVV